MHPTRAGSTQPLLDQGVHARKDVPGVAHAEVAVVEPAELLAVPGAAAIVDLEDERPPRRQYVGRVVLGVGGEEDRLIDAGRPAVDDAEQGVLPAGREIRGLDEHPFDRASRPCSSRRRLPASPGRNPSPGRSCPSGRGDGSRRP